MTGPDGTLPPWRRVQGIDRADVYVGELRCGELARSGDVVTLHHLDPSQRIAFGISPDRDVVAHGGTVPPFFAGLLPEGFRLTATLAAAKLSGDDQFGLLLTVGEDCIGDVSIMPAGSAPQPLPTRRERRDGDGTWIGYVDRRLALDSKDFDRAGVAGVHPKVSASEMITVRDKIELIKLSPPAWPLLCENEAFFMEMARHAGLQTARTRLVPDTTGTNALVVERFDRVKRQQQFERIHVEDACQFLSRFPSAKYDVTYREIADGIAQYATAPPLAILDLLRLVAFSALIGNGDLHAKNISLWRRPGTAIVELSPAYDIVSTIAYRGNDRMALALDGRDDDLRRRDLINFGERYHVGRRALDRSLDRMCDVAPLFAARVGEIGYSDRISARLEAEIIRRRDLLA